MKIGTTRFTTIFLILVAITSVASIALLIFVIPSVKAEVIRGGTPEIAVKAFWVNLLATLVSVFILLFIGLKSNPDKNKWKAVAVIPVLLLLLTGLACMDAAAAYSNNGEAMKAGMYAMVFSGSIQIITGIVVLILLFPMIKFTSDE